MKVGQTIIANVRTKSGGVVVTVNVIADGPKDGAAATMRDLIHRITERFADFNLSPPKELHDSIETAAMDTDFDGAGWRS